MARQSSEIRPAVPFVGLGPFELALDGIELEVSIGDDVIDTRGTGVVKLSRDRLLEARYRIVVARDLIAESVTRGIGNVQLPADGVCMVCFATSPTLKQTVLIHPARGDGRVLLEPVTGADALPADIPIDVESNTRLFHDISSGFRITYGFVLGRDVDTADALTPRWKGTWLARRTRRIHVERERTGSYEIHELTAERRRDFGLRKRPLFYVRQADDAVSPLLTEHLDDVVEIYVDADVLPLLRSERPGTATRFVASQIAAQVNVTILEIGARDLGTPELEDIRPDGTSVFGRALSRLNGRGDDVDAERIRQWVESDPGRLPAWVQEGIDQIAQAEALLAS